MKEVPQDVVLDRFQTAVRQTYGERVERMVLYGSRARGDFRPDSDYDIAVFLHDMTDWWEDLKPLVEITDEILTDTGAVISVKPFKAGTYLDAVPFMREVQKDGLDL